MSTKLAIVTGANGQVGHALKTMAWPDGWEVRALDRAGLDVADAGSVAEALSDPRCAVVINCGAYTGVDRAEEEVAAAWRANATGPAVLAEACSRRGIPLVHVSTDYVFDGSGSAPWKTNSPIAPINVYGASKAAGEFAVRAVPRHAVVRTSWVVSATGRNFVRTMIAMAAQRDEMNVVADQIGAPTCADDLAAALAHIAVALAEQPESPSGTYHFANAGETSWHGVAAFVFERMAARGLKVPALHPIPSTEFPTPAARPHNSRLSLVAIRRDHNIVPRNWQDAVGELVDSLIDTDAQ